MVLYDVSGAFNAPRGWIQAGQWQIDGDTTTGVSRTLVFYATDPDEVAPLQEHLADFEPHMAARSELILNENAALQAMATDAPSARRRPATDGHPGAGPQLGGPGAQLADGPVARTQAPVGRGDQAGVDEALGARQRLGHRRPAGEQGGGGGGERAAGAVVVAGGDPRRPQLGDRAGGGLDHHVDRVGAGRLAPRLVDLVPALDHHPGRAEPADLARGLARRRPRWRPCRRPAPTPRGCWG